MCLFKLMAMKVLMPNCLSSWCKNFSSTLIAGWSFCTGHNIATWRLHGRKVKWSNKMCLHAPEDFNHNIKSLKVVLWTVKHLSCWKLESNRFSKLKLTWIWDTSYWQSNYYFDRLEFLYFSEILLQRSMYRVNMIVKTELFYVELIFWLFLLILLLGIHTGLITSCLFITFREKQIKADIHHFFLLWKWCEIAP